MRLIFGLLLLVLVQQYAHPYQSDWKHYKNERWGFCVAYPSNWKHNEGINKAGIAVFPPQNRPSGLLSQMSIGALLPGRSNGHLMSLEEAMTAADETLKEEGASDLVLLDKRDTSVDGHPALLRKISYKEAVTGITWADVTISFRTSNGLDYSFELKSRPSELAEIEPIFNMIVFDTFRADCKYGHEHKGKSK